METACNYTHSQAKNLQTICLLFLTLSIKLPQNLPLQRPAVCWRKRGGPRNSSWKREGWNSSDKMKGKATQQSHYICVKNCIYGYKIFPHSHD